MEELTAKETAALRDSFWKVKEAERVFQDLANEIAKAHKLPVDKVRYNLTADFKGFVKA